MSTNLTRRNFMKLTGASALSLAAMSLLGGCSDGSGSTSLVDTALAGTTYQVGKYSVQLTGISGQKLTLSESTTWVETFKTGYKKVIANKTAYDEARPALKNAAIDQGIADADKAAKLAKVTATLVIDSTATSAILLGKNKGNTSAAAADLVSNSTWVTARCDGKTVPCTLGEITIEPGVTTRVPLAIAVPANFQTLKLTVAMPMSTPVLTYTFENGSYFDTSAYVPEA